MTNKQINRAIAEACPDKFRNENGVWFFQYAKDCWSQCHNNSICEDLNAMHEAEMILPIKKMMGYVEYLQKKSSVWFCADAGERAEAFLRTLGKWEEVQG